MEYIRFDTSPILQQVSPKFESAMIGFTSFRTNAYEVDEIYSTNNFKFPLL